MKHKVSQGMHPERVIDVLVASLCRGVSLLLPMAARQRSAVATLLQLCEIVSSNISLVGRCLVFMLTPLLRPHSHRSLLH
jgi:hypothetical protein